MRIEPSRAAPSDGRHHDLPAGARSKPMADGAAECAMLRAQIGDGDRKPGEQTTYKSEYSALAPRRFSTQPGGGAFRLQNPH